MPRPLPVIERRRRGIDGGRLARDAPSPSQQLIGPGKVFVVTIHRQPDAVRTLTKAGLSRRLNKPSPIETWPKAVPVFRYLRFVSDQEPASLQLTEIVSAGSIDFNPTKAPDVAPIDGPEIVTLSVAEEGTAPCPQPAHCCVFLFDRRGT